MYTIEYRGKHQNKLPNVSENIGESCSNIKSITIDYEDVEYFQYSDCPLSECLGGFVKTVQRLYENANPKPETINIPNEGEINRLVICAILNCDWMVLKVDGIDYEQLLIETIDELSNLEKGLKNTDDSKELRKIKRRTIVLGHCIETLNNKRRNGDKTYGPTLVYSNNPKKRAKR